MTKEQAAETKYPFHWEDDVKDKAELRNLRDAFCRGWEANETQSTTDAEITTHIKKLRELISLHMHPYNLGDMGETETAINRLILYVQQCSLRHLSPSKTDTQLFTREQIESAYVGGREDWQLDGHPYLFEEYMNTNYPTSK